MDFVREVVTTGIGALLGAWLGARFAYRDARQHAQDDARLARRRQEAEQAERFKDHCLTLQEQALRDGAEIRRAFRDGVAVDLDIVVRLRGPNLSATEGPTLVGPLRSQVADLAAVIYLLFGALDRAANEPTAETLAGVETVLQVSATSRHALSQAIVAELADLYPDIAPKRKK